MFMNKILRFFGIYFPDPVDPSYVKKRELALIQQIVANTSRGNISLQSGNYILGSTIDQIQKMNEDCDFEKGL